MEKAKYTWSDWLTTAVRGIRFRPDREAVRAELNAHIEDKIADLRRMFPDLSALDARELALNQMGDPEEVGRELARIHKPWLGYLWQVSRVAAAAMLLVLAISLVSHLRHNGLLWVEKVTEAVEDNRQAQVVDQILYGDGEPVPVEHWPEDWSGEKRLALWQLGESLTLGEAEVTFDRAALWQTAEGLDLLVQTGIIFDDPRDKSRIFPMYLQAEDSLGNHYGHKATYRENGASLSGFQSLGWHQRLDGYTWNFWLENVPEEAEWVCFTYALRPASDFELVINLKEGAK